MRATLILAAALMFAGASLADVEHHPGQCQIGGWIAYAACGVIFDHFTAVPVFLIAAAILLALGWSFSRQLKRRAAPGAVRMLGWPIPVQRSRLWWRRSPPEMPGRRWRRRSDGR